MENSGEVGYSTRMQHATLEKTKLIDVLATTANLFAKCVSVIGCLYFARDAYRGYRGYDTQLPSDLASLKVRALINKVASSPDQQDLEKAEGILRQVRDKSLAAYLYKQLLIAWAKLDVAKAIQLLEKYEDRFDFFSISLNFSNDNLIHAITQANDKKAIKPLVSALLSRIEKEVQSGFDPKVTIDLAQAFHQYCDNKGESMLLLEQALKDITRLSQALPDLQNTLRQTVDELLFNIVEIYFSMSEKDKAQALINDILAGNYNTSLDFKCSLVCFLEKNVHFKMSNYEDLFQEVKSSIDKIQDAKEFSGYSRRLALAVQETRPDLARELLKNAWKKLQTTYPTTFPLIEEQAHIASAFRKCNDSQSEGILKGSAQALLKMAQEQNIDKTKMLSIIILEEWLHLDNQETLKEILSLGKDCIKTVNNRESLHSCLPIISVYRSINSDSDIYEIITWLAEAFGNSEIPCEFLYFIIPKLRKILENKKTIFSKFIDLISKSFEKDKRHFTSLIMTYAEIEPEKSLGILDEHIAKKSLQQCKVNACIAIAFGGLASFLLRHFSWTWCTRRLLG